MQKFSWLSKKLACVFNFRQSIYKVKNTLVDLAEKLRGYKYRELFKSIYPESLQQACCFSSLDIAFLIVILVGLGWYMMDIEGQPGSEWYFNLHKSLGLIAFVLIALRTAWRLTHKPPTFATHQPTLQLVVSQFTHGLLYAAMILMPLTGFAAASLSEEGAAFFGIEIPRLVAQSPALSDQLFYIHELTAWVLVVFVAIHVLAALKHLVVNKDEVFGRMWF